MRAATSADMSPCSLRPAACQSDATRRRERSASAALTPPTPPSLVSS